MALYLCPTLIGTCLVWQLPRSNSNGLLVSYYMVSLLPSDHHIVKALPTFRAVLTNLFQMGSFVASLVLALQLPASNVGGYTKRVTATALVFLAYCIGNIIGPHAFLASEAPVYETGCQVGIACAAVQIVLAFALRLLLIRRNKKRDAMGLPPPDLDTAMQDLTDFENPHFRYSY